MSELHGLVSGCAIVINGRLLYHITALSCSQTEPRFGQASYGLLDSAGGGDKFA